VQKKCNEWWNNTKVKFAKNEAGLENAANTEFQRLGKEATQKSAASRFFFAQVSKSSFQIIHSFLDSVSRNVLGYKRRVTICPALRKITKQYNTGLKYIWYPCQALSSLLQRESVSAL